MKHLIILLAIMGCSVQGESQTIKKIKYAVSSVVFEDLAAPMRRTNPTELVKFKTSGSQNYKVAKSIEELERLLEQAANQVRQNIDINFLSYATKQLTDAKSNCTECDFKDYQEELEFYQEYNHRRQERLTIEKQRNDSIAIARLEEHKYAVARERAIQNEIDENRSQETEKRKAAEIAAFKAECIKKFGKKNGSLVAAGKVEIGMTKEMCLVSWGSPNKSNKTSLRTGLIETWYYDVGNLLTFKDGRLVSITE